MLNADLLMLLNTGLGIAILGFLLTQERRFTRLETEMRFILKHFMRLIPGSNHDASNDEKY